MNESSNMSSVRPVDGFSAASMDELEQIEGGQQTSMKPYFPIDTSSMAAFYQGLVNEVNRVRSMYPK